jgi:uncharacterized protein YgiM (DUF1202 family)
MLAVLTVGGVAALLAIPDPEARPVMVQTAQAALTPEQEMIRELREMAHVKERVEPREVAMAPLPHPAAAVAEARSEQADPVRRRVNASALNMRDGPSSQHPVTASLAQGTEVVIAESRDNWVRVVDPDGRSGWVYAKYLG